MLYRADNSRFQSVYGRGVKSLIHGKQLYIKVRCHEQKGVCEPEERWLRITMRVAYERFSNLLTVIRT